MSSALFCTIHVSHSHAPSGFLNLSPNPNLFVGKALTAENAEGRVNEGLSPVPGLAVSQATHFTASGLFRTRQVSQSHVPGGLGTSVPKPVVVVEFMLLLATATEVAGEGLLSIESDEVLGCGAIQQTHFVSDSLFCTKQTSQLHPGAALNKSTNPTEEDREEVVDVRRVVDCVEIFWEEASGEVRATGEAKPIEDFN